MTYRTGLTPLYMVDKPPFSIEASGYEPVPGETIPRVHPAAKNGLLTNPSPEVKTAFDLLKRSAGTYPNEPAMGSRRLVKTHKERKKVNKVVDGQVQEVEKEWTFFELSDYTYMTYKEYETMVLQVGAGLRKLGIEEMEKVHLYAATSPQWLGMAHACSSQSLTIVTAYDTLGESGVQHSLLQAKPSAIFLDPHLLKTVTNPLKKATTVKHLIYNNFSNQPVPEGTMETFKAAHPELNILSFEELRALGENHPIPPNPPQPEDLYCIMYTSGSTGPPKGVPITHASFVAGVTGLYTSIKDLVSSKEYVLAYLPLAHIFELVVENLVIFIGATLGYGNPRTLADSSMRNSAGDMRAFAPTVMVGVPQIWETVRKGVATRVEASGGLTKALFWGAFNIKSFLVGNGLPGQTAFDSIIFGKVRAMTGGRLRFIVNGASGISDSTAHFMSMVVAPMINGYGMTETTANGALGNPLQWTYKAIGAPPPAIEMKLVALPELNYSTDTVPPQGEILVRGTPVLKGYYENPEETAKAITADGWFRTGDIGELDANGHFKVIDRVKNLVKLQGGEYVALEKLEAIYRGVTVVQNIMVHADSEHSRPIAVICPNEKALADLAKELGVDEHEMHHDPKVRSVVLKDMLAAAKKGGLSGIELIVGVVIVDEEWTPLNGLTTATHKVNRRAAKDKYKKEIEACYGSE
ncbi:acetyl-CoA synthetase-like protein [Thozetella sp. PMI_491]|nr:acetyl-CoA synthetase-like protein [Thozetella sp. PMI_491]